VSAHENPDQANEQQCVFTTNTPVPAGHDKFPLDHVRRVIGRDDFFEMHEVFGCDGQLNMTCLALNLSHYVNVLDGWWIEGCIEGVTGWAVDGVAQSKDAKNRTLQDAKSLYQKLGQVVLPAFYQQRDDWLRVTLALCTRAAVGDVGIIPGISAAGALAAGDLRWGLRDRLNIYATAAVLGLVYAVLVEHAALAAGRWSYTERMPVMPVLGAGL
jgi:glucan phosphorylase